MKIIIFSMLLIINTVFVFSQEYNLYYSGQDKGFITIKKETNGKITITPRIQKGSIIYLSYEICSLLPRDGDYLLFEDTQLITIDGNTTTTTHSNGSWDKTVVDGTTTTTTHSNGNWDKKVVDGNTTTYTYSNGNWSKTVVNGNTTTTTHSDGYWIKTLINGNTTTTTHSNGNWDKKVVDGNTTTITGSSGSWSKTVVDKQGNDIYYITTQGSG